MIQWWYRKETRCFKDVIFILNLLERPKGLLRWMEALGFSSYFNQRSCILFCFILTIYKHRIWEMHRWWLTYGFLLGAIQDLAVLLWRKKFAEKEQLFSLYITLRKSHGRTGKFGPLFGPDYQTQGLSGFGGGGWATLPCQGAWVSQQLA